MPVLPRPPFALAVFVSLSAIMSCGVANFSKMPCAILSPALTVNGVGDALKMNTLISPL